MPTVSTQNQSRDLVKINDTEITVKEYMGQRVVTFKEIDQVHGRPDGTARKRFNANKKHFVKDVDFFMLHRGDNALSVFRTVDIPPMGITLLTQTGYLMLVKSFTDDLAWRVQRELVNNYFSCGPQKIKEVRPKETVEDILKTLKKYNVAMDVLEDLIGELERPEYRSPISQALQTLSFYSASTTWDLKALCEQTE